MKHTALVALALICVPVAAGAQVTTFTNSGDFHAWDTGIHNIFAAPLSGVLEPSTWAMMLLGSARSALSCAASARSSVWELQPH
jgi:hypothetical protein